jgi:hypothetical protein
VAQFVTNRCHTPRRCRSSRRSRGPGKTVLHGCCSWRRLLGRRCQWRQGVYRGVDLQASSAPVLALFLSVCYGKAVTGELSRTTARSSPMYFPISGHIARFAPSKRGRMKLNLADDRPRRISLLLQGCFPRWVARIGEPPGYKNWCMSRFMNRCHTGVAGNLPPAPTIERKGSFP